MSKKKYQAPVLLDISSGGNGGVIGDGSSQGSISPGGMSYEEWWEEIAWRGENPDADYNGDGEVDELDYQYWLDNELWNG